MSFKYTAQDIVAAYRKTRLVPVRLAYFKPIPLLDEHGRAWCACPLSALAIASGFARTEEVAGIRAKCPRSPAEMFADWLGLTVDEVDTFIRVFDSASDIKTASPEAAALAREVSDLLDTGELDKLSLEQPEEV